ncbi:MAG: protein-L-isoaspartate(D-aspartate) O-methyltransferase [Maricaulis maris]|jgi:protein-L-isoaspartate(D-aspartate) O-methyltransferase|uniref:Protein-L-isoaspartate O-methyltransferase n=1 Tax=Maricaulis maris (strain MCS10) TaxID=394221 RepID=PIMT_MARMM|nr:MULTISPECIES: protein-L-isoaspartate(D-aspartate) O-methyltransferase [Maricaulis]Q0ANE2.1 RecName: Full=Protein-L-isoaspartate O-methyltransferase; AltName: Full=L-isoaspartyl protein carboxyl methyltransferase; AltName: Full=Protein L-isoaspartyl methyltransferase; AltName: Full=Protein-beta-aspartate methyltransferase; Short=PIMT [Maricaulis maris MCS10]ABI66195.1 protein-L-isoaspartate O-methyltransferase [Maricaulis maris MCS10]MAC90486.1 protein-L-isoaspartate O-methyltransferase [Maric
MQLPDPRMIQLVMSLRGGGVTDAKVMGALERTPRHLFVPQRFGDQAYDDRALPIDCGQTISQPLIVALMTQALKLDDRCKVLEIGTGSGYQAAVLARLARRVYSVERYRTLSREAEARFEAMRLTNIVTRIGDGTQGWPEQAPFDRIILTASAPTRPDVILEQLKDGGIAVAPVDRENRQVLVRYARHGDDITETDLMDVRFVPLVKGEARAL